MKNMINQFLHAFGIEVVRYRPSATQDIVSLQPDLIPKGNVLLAYILDPFLLKDGESISQAHTNHIESLLIARTFLDLGYSVDVIDYRNKSFRPVKDYNYFISARTNFGAIAKHINKDCVKIAHLDTAHFVFNNSAAYSRLLTLQERRGISCASIRVIEHNFAAELADYLTILGNDFTLGTYKYADKPMFSLPVPSRNIYPLMHDKNFEACRNRFLWFGSGGFVHKGLDLVLEAFTQMPDYHLTVCGPIDEDNEFRQAYYKALYQTPNIRTVGWIDVSSTDFLEIVNDCVGLIYPSCSEGQCGAAVTCLQAGLIPLLSYESGLNTEDFGMILEDCSINTIMNTIRVMSGRSPDDLQQMSLKAWKYARANHTQEKYLERYRAIISHIISGAPLNNP